MSEGKTRRGRPKGTGIDDSDRIARLAELIRVHPDLKPTSAIKVMGITDPSIIRRLRDKYSAYLREAAANTAATPRPAAPAPIARSPAPGDKASAARH